MNAGLTVADLIDNPSLGTRVLAGGRGLDRLVLWAHSCELENPARWLGPHELLMTIGRCVPRSAVAQREFIAQLDEAGIAAIAIGDHQLSPRLSKSMIEEADKRSFPVLMTSADTPFATLSRTVAAAAVDDRTMAVLMLAKLYQVAVGRSPEVRRSGRDLGEIVGADITVLDEETGCVLVGEGIAVDPGQARDMTPDGSPARSHNLRTHQPARLLVSAGDGLDAFTLMHLTHVLTVDANAIHQDASAAMRSGRKVLERALTGDRHELASAMGAGAPGFRVVVTENGPHDRIAFALALSASITTLMPSGDTVVIVLRDDQVTRAREVLSHLGAPAGCSAAHRDLADLTGAVAEARSEHRQAVHNGQDWRVFTGEQVSLLARSRSEAEQICATVLGPLNSGDPKDATLRETLFAFLDHDQRWSTTADSLGVHRQSLVYRLNRVEELTGRNVRRTKDLAEFWLARTAWEQLHPTPAS